MDLLIIRRFYEPQQSGLFADVMILGRIIMFLVGPITSVILPKTATSLLLDPAARETRVVRRALILGAALLFTAAMVLSILAPWSFKLLGSPADPERIYLLRVAVWCLIPLALCQLVLPSLFASRQEQYLLEFTLLCLLLPLGLALFRGNLIYVFLVEGTVGFLLLLFVGLRVKKASS